MSSFRPFCCPYYNTLFDVTTWTTQPFVPDAAIIGDGSTSNADWWIRDFYDTAGGRQRDRASGTGGRNASAGMVHIK